MRQRSPLNTLNKYVYRFSGFRLSAERVQWRHWRYTLPTCRDKTKPRGRGKIIGHGQIGQPRCHFATRPTMYSQFYLRSASRLFLNDKNKKKKKKRKTPNKVGEQIDGETACPMGFSDESSRVPSLPDLNGGSTTHYPRSMSGRHFSFTRTPFVWETRFQSILDYMNFDWLNLNFD